MKRAAGIVTDHGGPTSHAAIVSRELGVPAVVGTGNATGRPARGPDVTLSCAEGDEGRVYDGTLPFETRRCRPRRAARDAHRRHAQHRQPAAAFRWWRLPADGVGLARMEFIISNLIRVHPMALVHSGTGHGSGEARRRSGS